MCGLILVAGGEWANHASPPVEPTPFAERRAGMVRRCVP